VSVTAPLRLVDLELDLEVFSGPFDLLLTLILREEVDLLEVDLAEVVISYVDHLERAGELDLESATEFLVLIAGLLELKSRLMLPGEELEELDLDPGEAAAELLERLLAAHRYRAVAAHLTERLSDEEPFRFRSAPLPPELRKASLSAASAVYPPARLVRALEDLLEPPPQVDVRHMPVARVSVAERLTHLRRLLRGGDFDFDEAVGNADRVTVAVTVFALLELYKQGEAAWIQDEPFGPIRVEARRPGASRSGARHTEPVGAREAASQTGGSPAGEPLEVTA
jgi:segregation and condensation protein A